MRTAWSCIHTRIITWAATPSFTALRSSACANKISARSNITAAFHLSGRSRTTSSNPITPRLNASTMCTGMLAKIRLNRAALVDIRFQPSATSRASGREVTEVHVERNGTKQSYSGKIVVVSGGAINSAALLLRSANDKHPNGLANGSDVVGRHYMGHVNSVLMALSKCPNPTVFQKTLSVNDFYFSSPEWEFPMGHISFVGKLDGDTLKAGAPKVAPKWTRDLMRKHSLDFWLTSEDLPDPNNRVTINRDGEIVLQYKPNNEEGHKRLIKKLESLMQQQTKCSVHGHECHEGLFARNLYLGQRIPLAGVAHQNGTIRFGDDPKTSALDRNCKTHELDNLYVVDASFFCSSGAVNPGLTIIANALRVGDHLLERVGAERSDEKVMTAVA